MGFSVTSSAIIVAAVFFIAASALIASLLNTGAEMAEAVAGTAYRSAEPLASLITIGNATLASDNTTLVFILSNNGSKTLWDFNDSDLIVTYRPQGSSSPATYRLVYGEDWSIAAILVNGGAAKPYSKGMGVMPSEAAIVEAVLPSPVDRLSEITIVFVNQYGGENMYRFMPGAG